MSFRHRVALVVFLATVYLVAMFLGTHLPLQGQAPAALPASGGDKVVHAAVYAGLAVIMLSVLRVFRSPSVAAGIGIVALIAAYAAVDEWTQGFVPTRTADTWDWAADVLGACLGAAAFLAATLLARRRNTTTD